MGWLSSFRRFRKLKRISHVLGAERDPSDFLKDLKSGQPTARDHALEELLDLCESDEMLSMALQRNGADRAALLEAYQRLIHFGGGQPVAGWWLPVITLGTPFALDFLLAQQDKMQGEVITVLLLEYFERHERGPVPTEIRGAA